MKVTVHGSKTLSGLSADQFVELQDEQRRKHEQQSKRRLPRVNSMYTYKKYLTITWSDPILFLGNVYECKQDLNLKKYPFVGSSQIRFICYESVCGKTTVSAVPQNLYNNLLSEASSHSKKAEVFQIQIFLQPESGVTK